MSFSNEGDALLFESIPGINHITAEGANVIWDAAGHRCRAKEFQKFDQRTKQILADMFVDMNRDAGEKQSTIQAAGMAEKNTTGEMFDG